MLEVHETPAQTRTGTDPAKQAALFAAIAKATFRAKAIEKDAENTHHHYRYASAEAVIEEARVPLAGEGVCVIQTWNVVHRQDSGDWFADVDCTYLVAHAEGGWLQMTVPFPAIRGKGRPEDKAIAASLTYSLGYFLRGLIMLPRVDAAADTDQRDDRDYEPRGGRQGDDHRSSNGNGNGHSSGVGKLPQANGQRAPANGNGNGSPASGAKAAPPIDIGPHVLAIANAPTVAALRQLPPSFPTFTDEQITPRDALRAVYGKRLEELRQAEASAAGQSGQSAQPASDQPAAATEPPAPEVAAPTDAPAAPADAGWDAGLAELTRVTGFPLDGWGEDDVLEEWHRQLKRQPDRKAMTAELGPWLQALKTKQDRSARLKNIVTMMSASFNTRMKELRDVPAPQQAAGGAA